MLRFEVRFYDGVHQESLKKNCEKYQLLKSLVRTGFDVEKEDLFAYAIFVEQKRQNGHWETYHDLQTKLPPLRQMLEQNFSISGSRLYANFETRQINNYHKEAIGVGASLSLVSRVYEMTEADWEKIPEQSRNMTLDFEIASTGNHFIEVEAKGSVVSDHLRSHLSKQKSHIEAKKQQQRDLGNPNMMIGVITAIPDNNKMLPVCFLLDPTPSEIPFDPAKYKLVARQYFYWRHLSMISGKGFWDVLVERIRRIRQTDNYRSLNRLPLLTRQGESHSLPESLFDTASVVHDRSAFGEVLPLGNDRFFFYGFDVAVAQALVEQDFDRLTGLSFESRVETDSRVLARIPTQLPEGPGETAEYDAWSEGKKRKPMLMVGDLTHTPAGRVLGHVRPVDRQPSTH